ncbi:hypothetical protein EJ02DRAFT_464316 [Clathrospora elynae]|uniref:Uncharacterized protein n=1 Tax=Clathrospora elynae TaxID=706981 RepID=A0A6A5SX00_9PLEO|nr:hypothetical protein EJ02DRAFT_464316 [Clathrospora elynae]
MRLLVAKFVKVFVSLSLVNAECCSQAGEESGQCYDGSFATLCCEVGSRNIFCCDCDGGCKQETKEYYTALAQMRQFNCYATEWLPEAKSNEFLQHEFTTPVSIHKVEYFGVFLRTGACSEVFGSEIIPWNVHFVGFLHRQTGLGLFDVRHLFGARDVD